MTTFTFLIGSTDPEVYSLTDSVERTENNIPLDDVIKMAEQDPIWAARGKAIQGYAQLENALCHLMAAFGDLPIETALTIFYKITNAGARNSILEKLLHQKHQNTFNIFWNSFVKELKPIDKERNDIVHWLAAANAVLNDKKMLLVGVTLIPPASVGNNKIPDRITTNDLKAFEKKCEEFSRLASMFSVTSKPPQGFSESLLKTWLEIFQQPLVYPLPADHPLLRQPSEPEIQPQSSHP